MMKRFVNVTPAFAGCLFSWCAGGRGEGRAPQPRRGLWVSPHGPTRLCRVEGAHVLNTALSPWRTESFTVITRRPSLPLTVFLVLKSARLKRVQLIQLSFDKY